MDIFRRATEKKWVGVGGWHCYCCTPSRRDHRKVRRYARRVIRRLDRKLFAEV